MGVIRHILSVGAGVVVALGGMIYFHAPVPEATFIVCNDGWNSPSVGRPGACSHHDGVNYDHSPTQEAEGHNKLVYITSILAGLFVFTMIEDGKKEKVNSAPKLKDDIRNTIEKAIKERRPIAFIYTKQTGSEDQRTVKPSRFVSFRRKSGLPQLCVQGFCYTRKADRTFALERMKNVNIITNQ